MSKRAKEAIRSKEVNDAANDYCSAYYDWHNKAEREAVVSTFKQGYFEGYEQAEEDLGWHSVDESLPPIDEEVIVLTQVPAFGKISFAHLVNSDVMITIDGKPYKPEAYSGWNIPGVKYWMPCPKLPEEEKV